MSGQLTRDNAEIPQSILLEQGLEDVRLNTGAMSDLQTLARRLLANFRTIRLPAEVLPAHPNLHRRPLSRVMASCLPEPWNS